MLDNHFMPLYKSELFQIDEFRCSGNDTARGDEEHSFNYEIVFQRTGMFVRYDASGKQIADANHILFFYPGQCYQIYHPVECHDTSTILTIAPELLREIVSRLNPALLDQVESPLPASAIQMEMRLHLLQAVFTKMMATQGHFDLLGNDERYLNLVWQLFETMIPLDKPLAHDTRTFRAQAEIVYAVKLLINRYFREKLTLNGLAGQVHYSAFALARVFRQHAQLSIYQYVLRLRLLYALEELLEYPHRSISEIGVALGFASPSHFSTAFLEVFGIQPSAYRKTATMGNLRELQMLAVNDHGIGLGGY